MLHRRSLGVFKKLPPARKHSKQVVDVGIKRSRGVMVNFGTLSFSMWVRTQRRPKFLFVLQKSLSFKKLPSPKQTYKDQVAGLGFKRLIAVVAFGHGFKY